MDKVKIYFVPAENYGRAYKGLLQGLKNNPRIKLVESHQESDFVFYNTFSYKPELNFPRNKTIFIDYTDDPSKIYRGPYLLYFKRSWPIVRRNGAFFGKFNIKRPKNLRPISYSIMDEYIVENDRDKDIDLSCMLRQKPANVNQTNRKRTIQTCEAIKGNYKMKIGAPTTGGLRVFDNRYLSLIRRSKLLVTSNPDIWEGDNRTWEALANKPLVFVDRMVTPMKHPLIDGEHCIIYDHSNVGHKELKEKIEYYLEHEDEARKIAEKGHEFAMRYHRTSNRIDEILEEIEKV